MRLQRRKLSATRPRPTGGSEAPGGAGDSDAGDVGAREWTSPGSDELLSEGVARLLAGTHYAVAPSGYARLTRPLRRRALPQRLPPAAHGFAGGARGSSEPLDVETVVFFDIESLGFIGRPLFLIGAIHGRAGGDGLWDLELVQYLARDYSEEEAILAAFAADAAGSDLCVTFNGRTFDLPFLETRSAFFRIEPYRPPRHLDLLPVARRCWGARLPNCRLKTLEHLICGRPRSGLDIESARVPEAYHRFVRTGEPFELLEVLGHNASDLASLVELHIRAAEALADAGSCSAAQPASPRAMARREGGEGDWPGGDAEARGSSATGGDAGAGGSSAAGGDAESGAPAQAG